MVFLAAVGTACSGKLSAYFFCVYLCGVMLRSVGDGALDVPLWGVARFEFP